MHKLLFSPGSRSRDSLSEEEVQIIKKKGEIADKFLKDEDFITLLDLCFLQGSLSLKNMNLDSVPSMEDYEKNKLRHLHMNEGVHKPVKMLKAWKRDSDSLTASPAKSEKKRVAPNNLRKPK